VAGRGDELLDRFERDGWQSEPYDRMLEIAHSSSVELQELVMGALQRLDRSATFIDHALSFLSAEQFAEAIELAVELMLARGTGDGDTPAESVIAHASVQFAHLLSPHLRALWDLAPNERSFYAPWPWRAAPPDERERLLDVLARPGGDETERAWKALIETRDPISIQSAVALGPPLPHAFNDYLALVGHVLEAEGSLRRLAPERCLHLLLPAEVLASRQRGASHLRPENHPTWQGVEIARARFGGTAENACGCCGGTLHRLVDLDPVPHGLGVTSRARLELAACLSCVGWAEPVLFYVHAADGTARAIPREGGFVEAEWPAEPLMAAEVGIAATPARWRFQDWGLSNSRENLNRLGGEPTWIQNGDFPECPGCARTMGSLLQLDSELTTESGGDWLWGSGGIGYVAWCDGCAISGVTFQCT
jgi:hypothetical protein